jgi:hypothetical protein
LLNLIDSAKESARVLAMGLSEPHEIIKVEPIRRTTPAPEPEPQEAPVTPEQPPEKAPEKVPEKV